MSFQVQERPIELLPQVSLDQTGGLDLALPNPIGELGGRIADSIGRFPASYPHATQNAGAPFGGGLLSTLMNFIPGGNVIAQLFAMLQQFLSGSNGLGYGDNERYFQNATGGSVGDPHLSFNGSTWDNMGSQPDLLHSDSFEGGYQLSTQTTAPSANGITYNQSATVSTNNGATNVTFDKNGTLSISQYGNSFQLQPGQSIDLDNGEFVQRNADGSVDITCNNGYGGNITTTMRVNGAGVDVTTQANNVDLGGALVSGPNSRTLQPMQRLTPHFI